LGLGFGGATAFYTHYKHAEPSDSMDGSDQPWERGASWANLAAQPEVVGLTVQAGERVGRERWAILAARPLAVEPKAHVREVLTG
jgi:hypothetical protein